jgi:hypothetical protein
MPYIWHLQSWIESKPKMRIPLVGNPHTSPGCIDVNIILASPSARLNNLSVQLNRSKFMCDAIDFPRAAARRIKINLHKISDSHADKSLSPIFATRKCAARGRDMNFIMVPMRRCVRILIDLFKIQICDTLGVLGCNH